MSFAGDAASEAVALPKPSPESNDGETGRAIELEDSLVAEEPFALPEQAMLEKKDPAQLHDGESTISLGGGDEKPDLQPVNVAPGCEEIKLPERGIHSLTHSVTGDSSRPISEVEEEDDVSRFDETGEVSSENSVHESPQPEGQKGQRGLLNEDHALVREAEGDDFEGVDGEIDSVTGGQPQGLHSEFLRRRIASPNGRVSEGAGNEEDDGGEVVQASPELQDTNLTNDESKLGAVSGQRYPLHSKSEEFGANEDDFEAKKRTDSVDVEEDDAASNLGTQSTDPYNEDEEAAQQLRLDSEIGLLSPHQLIPEDIINPLSLEGGTNRSILLDSEEISPDEPNGISERAVETGFPSSQVKERFIRTDSLPENGVEDAKEALTNMKPGAAEAVLLGALASGVNRPTWFVIKAVLVGLVASLFLLLHVAIKSESTFVLLNVLLLISIAGGLIVLLTWYIFEIGLVSVDKQIEELSLTSEPRKVESKTL